jgi:hypothetical protein
MAFNENTRVKIPAILHICRLGYGFKNNLASLFAESKTLEKEIQKQLNGLTYE